MNRFGILRLLAVLVLGSMAFAAEAPTPRIDKILVLKRDRKLLLLSGAREVRSYRVALGRNPVGPKTYEGDNRTPEGFYKIIGRNAASSCHRSLRISYPNATDRARARKLGKKPGGDIVIHGLPNGQGWIGKSHALTDWTFGCIAVTDEEIEELWNLVPNGTVVEIRP